MKALNDLCSLLCLKAKHAITTTSAITTTTTETTIAIRLVLSIDTASVLEAAAPEMSDKEKHITER